MNNVRWHLIQFGGVRMAAQAGYEIVVNFLGDPHATAFRLKDTLDAECLELFPIGTILLAQILNGMIVDWTLAPTKGYNPPQLPGDEWKNQQ